MVVVVTATAPIRCVVMASQVRPSPWEVSRNVNLSSSAKSTLPRVIANVISPPSVMYVTESWPPGITAGSWTPEIEPTTVKVFCPAPPWTHLTVHVSSTASPS